MPFPLDSLLYVIVIALVAGVVIWFVNQMPIDGTIKVVVRAVIIAVFAIWLIYALYGLLVFAPIVPLRR